MHKNVHIPSNSHTEPLPSSIDSWARGIVPQQSNSSLQSKISTAEPVPILPFIASMSATAASEQQGEDVTDSQQKQHRISVQSETNTSISKLFNVTQVLLMYSLSLSLTPPPHTHHTPSQSPFSLLW